MRQDCACLRCCHRFLAGHVRPARPARRSTSPSGADLFNTTFEAGRIGTISIDGLTGEDASDADLDEIHAWTGQFRIEGLSWSGRVDDGRRFGDRWFGSLQAWVGRRSVTAD